MNDVKPIIEVRDLDARYGERRVLYDLSFDVYPGEILAVIGPSGGGKTTLLRHMIGLLKPAAGRIRYWGEDIAKMDEEELARVLRRIGISFQSAALFNSMSVAENVALPLEEYGRTEKELIPILVGMKLGLVGMANFGYLMPSELSGGMKKRVGFARSIATDPEIVYFDEPSADLDPITAAGLDQLILDIRKLTEVTMVVVTHELASIRTVADRVLMLDGGRIAFMGSIAEAERSPEKRVRQFFDRQPDKTISEQNFQEAAED
jgi:phospholipid/cholesterol/gamma-HCH transport system ATP-binding protein